MLGSPRWALGAPLGHTSRHVKGALRHHLPAIHWEMNPIALTAAGPQQDPCRPSRLRPGGLLEASPECLSLSGLPCDTPVSTSSICQLTASKATHDITSLSFRRPYTRLTRSGTSAASFLISELTLHTYSHPSHTPTEACFTLDSSRTPAVLPIPHRQLRLKHDLGSRHTSATQT